MKNLVFDDDVYGNEDIPFESRICGNCFAINWVPGFIKNKMVQSICCWRCASEFWLDEFAKTQRDISIDIVSCNGVPDPVIPVSILRTLINIASDYLSVVRSDPSFVDEWESGAETLAEEIEESIECVKSVLDYDR